MKFSSRTDWQFESSSLGQSLSQLKGGKKRILDLTCANPTQVGLSYFSKEMISALASPENAVYDPDPFGSIKARQAVVRYYEEYGIHLDPSQILLTSSTSEAYSFLFRLLINPNEGVCFPQPSYPLFELLSGVQDIDWNTYRFVYTGSQWQLDQDSLKNCLDGRNKAVVIVNPNNPTGSFLSFDDIEFLYHLCSRRDAAVICDEVFIDYAIEPGCRFLSLAGRQDHLTFVLGGLSKALGLPQMKLSWIVVNGPEKEKQEAIKRLEMIADIYLSVNAPVQNALPGWLAQRKVIQRPIQRRVRNNARYLEALDTAVIDYIPAQAGWGAVLRLPHGIEEETFCSGLLKKEHVAVYPGYFFDFEMAPVIVVSLLPEEKVFQDGIQKIISFLER